VPADEERRSSACSLERDLNPAAARGESCDVAAGHRHGSGSLMVHPMKVARAVDSLHDPCTATLGLMGPPVVLGHGASGTAASMAPWVEGLRRQGLEARAINLPRGRGEDAVPAFLEAVGTERAVVLGGHSFGGRVASLAATRLLAQGRPVAGLLLLSYPLHRPGEPDTWRERTAHWPQLSCPVLLLSGERDPFARLPLLREAASRLPDGTLATYPRLGHGLLPVLDDALARAVAFIGSLRQSEDEHAGPRHSRSTHGRGRDDDG
jgi:predicted alpha/beta-hydrolase family hydrolase